MAGFVYAIFDNEESVYQILHTCSTKMDRTLDDGRCEYYLEVHSQRPTTRRKSVRSLMSILSFDSFLHSRLDSNHSLVCGESFEHSSTIMLTIAEFQEDSQWTVENEYAPNGYASWEQRLGSTECINRTVFVGALHGMMTAFALARICQELFGDVEYAAIDTDRNKYPIGKRKTCAPIVNDSSIRFGSRGVCQCAQLLCGCHSELFDDRL